MRPFENPRWAPAAAALLPLLVYACTASGHDYWLDSGEFVAAAIDLDIAHPPGHPLAQLWAKAFTLLPVGPLPYRAALAQAVAGALALSFVQVAIARSIARVTAVHVRVQTALSLAAVYALAGSYAFWFQAVRAEVYALQALLVCCALERTVALACDAAPRDPRPLYVACAALGLGLANHHFIALLALPSLLLETLALVRARGARVLGYALGAGALGLSTYVYLPLRAARLPPMDFGHPTTLSDFLWVVSAQVYARRIGSEAVQPLGERFADLIILIVENFTLIAPLLALIGAYALARTPSARRLAYVLIMTAAVSLGGRAYLNPVRANPDVLGYMMPGFAALLALAACAVALSFKLLMARARVDGAATRVLAPLAASLIALLATLQFARESPRASLRTFSAPTHFDDLRRRALPPRSLLILTTPDAVFRHYGGEAVERLRADVVMLPVPFLGYGSTHEVLLARHPELAPLVSAYLERGELDLPALRALAATRPLFLELDTRVSFEAYPEVAPEGLLYRFGATTREAFSELARVRDAQRARLDARLDGDLREPETRRQLLWSDYVAALVCAGRGERELSLAIASRALVRSPGARELVLLRDALLRGGSGPMDVRPFFPDAAARDH